MMDSSGCTRKLRVRKERKLYSDEWALGDDDIEGGTGYNIPDKMESDRFDQTFVKEMNGPDFNVAYLQKSGFSAPILFKDKAGLGLQVPSSTFTVNDVRTCVGSRRIIEVMDVVTQKNIEMTMKEFQKYYDDPNRGDRLLNVISLEFSHTRLENYIRRPNIVRQIDWVDCVWPSHLREAQREATNAVDEMMYPKVQKYCLMSVKGCYTDFHVDFGGTSVWYHILKGSKVFWLIPPTEQNIHLYEQWVLSGKQSDIFFGDTVEKCGRVFLSEGDTFFIPTGWVHAVYTLKDSLVFGGNFLHSFGIEKQLRIAEAEDTTRVPQKFRYPFFTEQLWYVLDRYVYTLLGTSHLKLDGAVKENRENTIVKNEHVHLTPQELHGLKAIIKYVHTLPTSKKSVPSLIVDPVELIKDVRKLIEIHCHDNPDLAITGKTILMPQIKEKKHYKLGDNGDIKSKIVRRSHGNNNGPRRRRTRCKKCQACLQADCGECTFCHDMVKFGGPGRAKQTCVMRQCLQPMLPVTAACMVCSLDGWGQQIVIPIQKVTKETPSSLMECCICYEIVHPECIAKSVTTSDGAVNEDLPNSWECPKCCKDGKNVEYKPRHFRARQKCSDIRRPSVGSDTSSCNKRLNEMDSELSDVESSDSQLNSEITAKTEIKDIEIKAEPMGDQQENESCDQTKLIDIKPIISTDGKLLIRSPDTMLRVEVTKDPIKNKFDLKKYEIKKSDCKKYDATFKAFSSLKKRKLGQYPNGDDGVIQIGYISPNSSSRGSNSNIRWLEEINKKSQDDLIGNNFSSKMNFSPEPRKVALRTQLAHHLSSNSNKILKRPSLPVRPAPISHKTQISENSCMPTFMTRRSLHLVFKHLTQPDLVSCTLVCKAWSTVSVEPSLWKKITVTTKNLTANALSGIVRRQPEILSMDWTAIAKRQFEWLIARLPQLRELSVKGCSWNGISALRLCTCPPLTYLDLSFVSGMNDSAIRDILSPPKDTRPGLVDTKSRLRNLKTFKLAGCDITDISLRYVVQNILSLSILDLSQCSRITDAGIAQLTAVPATTLTTLTSLDLSGLSSITDISIEHLSKCTSLKYLDLRHTALVTNDAVNKFLVSKPELSMLEEKLIVSKCSPP